MMDISRFFILVSLLLSFHRCRAQQSPVVTHTVNATDQTAFIYSGQWRKGSGTCEGGMLTSTPGSSVSFRFKGTDLSFSIHGVSASQRGALVATLDGAPIALPALSTEATPNCGQDLIRVILPPGEVFSPDAERILVITLRDPVAPSTQNNVVVFSASFSAPPTVILDPNTTSSTVPLSTSSSIASFSATASMQPMTALDISPSSPISSSTPVESVQTMPMSTAINARSDANQGPLGTGAIVGIVIGALAVLVIGISALMCTRRYDRRHEAPNMLSNQDLERIADRAVNAAFPTTASTAEPVKGLADGAIQVVLPFTYAASASDISLDKKGELKATASPSQESSSGSMFGFMRKGREHQQQRQSQLESFLPLYSPRKPKPSTSSPTVSTPNAKASSSTTPQIPRRPSASVPRFSFSLVGDTDTGYSPAHDHPDGKGLEIKPARRPSYARDMYPDYARRPSTANSGKSGRSVGTIGTIGTLDLLGPLGTPATPKTPHPPLMKTSFKDGYV